MSGTSLTGSRLTALAVAAVLTAGCGTDAGPAAAPRTTPSPVTGTVTATPTSGEEPVDDRADDAVQVVRAWLGALAEGDLETAAGLLGASSLRAAEDVGGLEAMASGLAEGMAQLGDEGTSFSAVAVPGHAEAYVVTASGEVTREGMTEQAAHAWLVHPQDGSLVVEAFSSPPPEPVTPLPGEAPAPDQPVEVLLPAGAPHALVDGDLVGAAVSVAPADDRLRVSVAPEDGWDAGRHLVTVVTVPEGTDDQGPWAATAVTFEVS